MTSSVPTVVEGLQLTTDVRRHAVTIGRYMLHRQIARGGMATIHIARLMGDEGFSRIVAAKRLHPEFAEDAEFVQMFLDEARIASKIHHRNVVPVLDVVTTGDEVVLVQEYVHGVPLHWLLRTAHEAKTHVPINVAVSVACQVLAGLHAAHETADEMGAPLNIVHRDVSPQNVMISTDGTARLLDFGVAKASLAAHTTRDGTFKGKLAYSAPEQIRGRAVRQSDVYSLSVVLWELIVGHRMHGSAQAEAELIGEILSGHLPTITDALTVERDWLGSNRWKQLEMLEPIICKGLSVEAEGRYPTAAEMEAALATAVPPASPTGVAAWLKALGKSFLEGRDRVIAEEEASWRRSALSSSPRRLTSIPPELRSVRRLGSERDAAGSVQLPQAPEENDRKLVMAVIAGGALLLALIVMLVILVRGHDHAVTPSASAVDTPPPAPAAALPVTIPPTPPSPPALTVAMPPAASPPEVAPAASVTVAPAVSAVVVPPPSPEPPPAPAKAVSEVQRAAPVRSAPPPVRRPPAPPPRVFRVARPVQQASAPPPSPPPAPTPAASPPPPDPTPAPAPPAATPQAAPKDDCSPPYYFEGRKKVFKSNCL
jgi:serine/threonine-protein kinase